MIVWLLHGCRLEVNRNLVQIISDANVPVAWSGASGFKKKKKTVPPWRRISEKSYSALHWITLHFSSPQLQTFPKHPPEQADYTNVRGWPGLCANSSNSHESVFTHHHTEDAICWCCFFFCSFFFFWQSCIEELIPPLSGVPCESVTFSVPSISSCRFLCHLCTTHLPCILSWRRVPLYIMRKVLWTTQQSSRDLHRKWTPEESHSA